MPAIDEKVIQKYNNGGTRDVCVVFQEDNAGLHNDKIYNIGKKALFDAGGHILFNQPPQSPTTNVHDFTIFPMMSKRCSREQALTYEPRIMKGEEFNKAVMKVWKDKKTLPAFSRGFAGHPHVVSAILEHDGDNIYLNDSKGTSFRVRTYYATNEDQDGVVVEEENEDANIEVELTGEFLARRAARKLKYSLPDISTLTDAKLTPEMKEFLRAKMDPNRLADDVVIAEAWMRMDEEDAANGGEGVG